MYPYFLFAAIHDSNLPRLSLSDLVVKGIREPNDVKKKSFDLGGNRNHELRIRSTVTVPIELRGRTNVGDD